MFNVKCIDVAGDGLAVEFNSTLETLAEVETLVVNSINEKLGVSIIQLEHGDELVYTVWLNGHDIGIVAIRDVNPEPSKRKRE